MITPTVKGTGGGQEGTHSPHEFLSCLHDLATFMILSHSYSRGQYPCGIKGNSFAHPRGRLQVCSICDNKR